MTEKSCSTCKYGKYPDCLIEKSNNKCDFPDFNFWEPKEEPKTIPRRLSATQKKGCTTCKWDDGSYFHCSSCDALSNYEPEEEPKTAIKKSCKTCKWNDGISLIDNINGVDPDCDICEDFSHWKPKEEPRTAPKRSAATPEKSCVDCHDKVKRIFMDCADCFGFSKWKSVENEFKTAPKRPAATQEPMSTGNGQIVITEVMRDLLARDEVGREKYKTSLKTDNGRDALMDAYQEACDLVMYLKQALMEREE